MNPRYARHVSLPEIGEAGQARLSAARVVLRGDPRAAAIARVYLERAGVSVSDGDTGEGDLVELAEVRAGRPELEAAARFLAGAWTAVEAIKATVGAGRPARSPTLALTGPEGDA